MEKDILEEGNIFLIPPYIPKDISRRVLLFWKSLDYKNHVFLFSSGTTHSDNYKTYALSKESIINNAKAVNTFLQARKKDKWYSVLPFYHIGGLSIYFRAALLEQKVMALNTRWNAQQYYEELLRYDISYSSLVPTQLYDLIQLNLSSPKKLKGVFVGGDFLASAIKEKALELGWPIILTYGMTECCSQIATSFAEKSKEGFLEVLPLHFIEKNNSLFTITSKSLYSSEILFMTDKEIVSNTEQNQILLPDQIELLIKEEVQYIRPMGRSTQEIKIKGRLYHTLDIQDIFETALFDLGLWGKAQLLFNHNLREGKEIKILIVADFYHLKDKLFKALDEKLPKIIKKELITSVPTIMKTELGKIKAQDV